MLTIHNGARRRFEGSRLIVRSPHSDNIRGGRNELGTGIGDLQGQAFRIAHMGHVNAPMILGTLAAVEMALKINGVPHTPGGVEAAMASLTA